MNQPAGLSLFEDFIGVAEEVALLGYVDAAPWRTDLRRRVQHYGYRYDYRARVVDRSMYLGALPDWTSPLLERIGSAGVFPEWPDQLIVNEYTPGQGIAPHIDCVPCFGPVIVSLSLGSACSMEFSRGDETVVVHLPVRSLLVLSGDARHQWRHGIRSRRSDSHDHVRFPRERRISLTFRKTVELVSVQHPAAGPNHDP